MAANGSAKVCPTCLGRYPLDFNVCPKDATKLEAADAGGDPLIGAVLGQTYQVMRALGEGGMGKVYEARHLRLTTRRFAVKILHLELARQTDVLSRFQREAEAAAAIDHAHVLDVFDVARTEDGRPYIVGEFLQGQDFHEYLEKVHKLDVGLAVAIGRQVASALAAAHRAGIVHRDLKPENLFVIHDRQVPGRPGIPFVKVLDFGISKIVDSEQNLTRTGMVMGTPNYMAPEQARGDKVDHRADIYAFGAILYRMLTGKRAFEGTDPSAVMTAVIYDEPVRPRDREPSIPEAMEVVIQRLMAKDARDRYQSMDEVDGALAAFDQVGFALSTPAPFVAPSAVTISPIGSHAGDAAAQTMMGSAGGAAGPVAVAVRGAAVERRKNNLESQGREAKLARPTLLSLTPVAAGWLFVLIVSMVAGILREIHGGREISESEGVLSQALAAAIGLTPLILWINVVRKAWRNSVRTIELAADLRRFLAGSLAGYGLALIIVRFSLAVVSRDSRALDYGRWDVVAFLAALLGGGLGGGIGPLARVRRRLLNA
jgi:serine/threonine-protein kinase